LPELSEDMSENTDQPLELDNPFWHFSLAVYAMPGVQHECLSLQNEAGVNVNILLYCAWRGTVGDRLTGAKVERLAAAVQDWQANVVMPLRGARDYLKRFAGPANAGAKTLRSKILEAELLGEQVEQAILYKETASDFQPGEDRAAAIDANLALCLKAHGKTPDDARSLKTNAERLARK
jgi:uncharacterized protein (TIGR02444 family)